uniref:Heparan-alpha-glucosaminide N-acetyltransferase catalytic domain-containing protein n=1 Tax=Clytia hemisphaerica TaxID=252671 RepID=A0A7M5X958_9CNID
MKFNLFQAPIVIVIFTVHSAVFGFESCDIATEKTATLLYDEALLVLDNNSTKTTVEFNAICSNCYKCLTQPCVNATVGSLSYAKISTRFPFRYDVVDVTSKTKICSDTFHFGEHGHYQLVVNDASCSKIEIVKKPIFTYLPLVVLFSIILVLMVSFVLLNLAIQKYNSTRMISYESIPTDDLTEHSFTRSNSSHKSYGSLHNNKQSISVGNNSGKYQNSGKYMGAVTLDNEQEGKSTKRLRSLDTFRGISIVVMIFVNYGGGKYWFFNHSKWNGLTVADLVFPWFIFIMGASIFISCRSMRRKTIPKITITKKIIVRSIKLFALGLFINNGKDYEHWRIPGVLQRFALSYLVVAILNVWCSPEEETVNTHYHYDWRDSFRDLTWFPLQHFIMLILLVVYLCLTFLLPVPGCKTGYLGPGGLSDNGTHTGCTGGAAAYIDRKIFGLNHMYNSPTCRHPYKCGPHDPEGFLGVIPSILMTYFGLMAARMLFMYSRPKSHIKRWMIWALIMGAIAIGLCGGKKDGGLIPINKNLWSISFICATAAMAFVLLIVCYVTIDVKKWWSGAPFYFAGMNAIMLYCGHEILSGYFPFDFNNNGQHDELLTQAAVGTGVWLIIAYSCFKSDIFWKV